VTAAFPVAPLVGPVARPGTDWAGRALMGAYFESEGQIGRVTFLEGSVVLPVFDYMGLAGLYAAEQAVFARMLEVRGGLDDVLGAAVRVRDTGNGLELRFCAAPVGQSDRPAHAPAEWRRAVRRHPPRRGRVTRLLLNGG
jgi:hypothetical protein